VLGHVHRVRADLGAELVEALSLACQRESVGDPLSPAPSNVEEYVELLGASAPIQRRSSGPAYRFPTELPHATGVLRVTEENAGVLADHFGKWLDDPPECQPFLALVVQQQVVSVCASVRITQEVHEAGVETHADFRGSGYAAYVVAAWATAVREEGATPVYSTSWENKPSQAVARKLELILFGVDFLVT